MSLHRESRWGHPGKGLEKSLFADAGHRTIARPLTDLGIESTWQLIGKTFDLGCLQDCIGPLLIFIHPVADVSFDCVIKQDGILWNERRYFGAGTSVDILGLIRRPTILRPQNRYKNQAVLMRS